MDLHVGESFGGVPPSDLVHRFVETLLHAGVTGPFGDVPCGSPFAPWVQALVARGITAGCGGGLYCPTSPVTRGQMAVFLTKTFALGLYGG